MKNLVITLLTVFGSMACSQQRLTSHTPASEYGEKGPEYSDLLMNKLENGIDFIASGSEPFWSLEIDFDKQIHFVGPHGDSINVEVPDAIRLQDVAATSYSAKTGNGHLTIVVYDQPCVDNLTGKELPKTVHISASNKEYKGCGSYLSDYRLNDIWVLESINDHKIKISDFPKGLPRMELSLTQNQVFAFAGCNEFSGSMEVMGKKIRFGRFSGTLMACQHMNFESEYLGRLANKTVPFHIEPGKLSLQVSTDSTFNYMKVD